MSHDLTASQIAATEASVVRPVLMARLDFSSGPVLAHTGVGTITYNSEDYLGVGQYGGAERVEESLDVRPNGIQLTLSGIPSEYISIALGEHYQGREAKLLVALLDEGHQLIGSPVVIWLGRMDYMNLDLGETATITVSAESKLADWDRPRVRRYSHEDQTDLYPGDLGLAFVAKMVDKDILWGRG